MKEKTVEKKPLLARFMDGVETVCNKLPPPTMLFVFLFFIVAILGTIFTFLGTSLTNPAVAFRAKCKIFSRHLQKPILKTEKGRFKGL